MRVISRRTGDGIEVFDADLESARVFPAPPGTRGWAVTSTRDGLVCATDDAVIRLGPDGRQRWRFDAGRPGPHRGAARLDAAFSADDTLVWVYAPHVLADRGDSDEWIVLDAATGTPRSRRPLPVTGHGGSHFPLRDGRMLLDVGEGQDGSRVFLAAADGDVHDYGWGDRVLIDVSPDQRGFMTVEHQEQRDVAFHDLAGGAARFRLGVADFGADPELAVIEWAGGYLDADTAVVVVYGEDGATGEPWWRHHRVAVHTGEVLGDLGIVTIDENDLRPLGDGTYVISDTDGTLRRM
ncbi:hypothetical protein [Actinoplanes teichomyceticus]|uniref:WD40 repeat protein n=1 Tax=Actinoplanes teichomyceticus TaxID=1867 RepID=A0A561VR13_ACTTI|nr:hypothetical protein [Actinoplanes teichomyceticus]TWG14059.1 hypothetical protein FHX34_104353 [Actinoplanes teichomyceticus]GIF16793.1 hypothetical protein Ate01nite_68250 [Actinoplanes teichomyceticus]